MKYFVIPLLVATFFVGMYIGTGLPKSKDVAAVRKIASLSQDSLTFSKQNVESCTQIFRNQSFEEIIATFNKVHNNESEVGDEASALVYRQMIRLLPNLSDTELQKLYKVSPNFILLNGKKLNSTQKTFIESLLIADIKNAEKPHEYISSEIFPSLRHFQPISKQFLKLIVGNDKVGFGVQSLVLQEEMSARNELNENLKPFSDFIIQNASIGNRESFLQNYLEAVASKNPGTAVDAFLDFQREKIIDDPYGNIIGHMVSSLAVKSVDDAIDFINENHQKIVSYDSNVAGSIVYYIMDKQPEKLLHYIDSIESEKIQLDLAWDAYGVIQRKKSPELSDDFLKMISANPKLYEHVLKEAKSKEENDRKWKVLEAKATLQED